MRDNSGTKCMEDEELGRLVLHTNVRARRLTFRTKTDSIYITVPPGIGLQEVKEAIESLRPRLHAARQRLTCTSIDLNFRIETDSFHLNLIRGERAHFLARSAPGMTQIICPPDIDFTDKQQQEQLRKIIKEALRRNAKIILPPRLNALAAQHGCSYKNVKINSSQSRWGSCSTQGNINLSCYLLLLPARLIDYVLLHELAHTYEMSHNERFWKRLDQMTDGGALRLREELKKYKTDF